MEKKNKLIVIIGPTAAKKTTIAHQIALTLNGAIINGDAFQVYKELNIGVNKPSSEMRNQIPYYLIDIICWKDKWSIFDFQLKFDEAYQQILLDHKMPILCGGSHLYIDCIVNGYDLSKKIEDVLIEELNLLTNKELYDYIEKYDYSSALKIGINNRKRLLRCAAIIKSNNNISKSITDVINNNPKYKCLIIMVTKDRDQLYIDINNRFDDFYFNNDWVNEVKELLSIDKNIIDSQMFNAIGYREIAHSIINNSNLDIQLIKQKTRQLAKRQICWCNNKFKNKIIFNYCNNDIDSLIEVVQKFYYD